MIARLVVRLCLVISLTVVGLASCGGEGGGGSSDSGPEPDSAVDTGDPADTGSPVDTATDSGPVDDTTPPPDTSPPPTDTSPPPTDTSPPPPACEDSELSSLYTQYVEPFVSGAVATSCSQCHMTGIDISMYAQDTPCQTMACMVSLGAVNLDEPENSQLLAAIKMGDTQSSVFDVDKEYEAMLEWITWSSQCHSTVCADVESPCSIGTGAASTGVNPIGDCSENDLLVVFWDAVIVDRGRCNSCHSAWGQAQKTFGGCTTTDECTKFGGCKNNNGDLQCQCLEGKCSWPGPYFAPNFIEGGNADFKWNNAKQKQFSLNTMYNVVALGLIDEKEPLNSKLLVKPLLEDFQPTSIYGDGVDVANVPAGVGVGITHGGSSKFNFGCYAPESPGCPTDGVVDCRTATPCQSDGQCADGQACLGLEQTFCRVAGSYCDATYTNYVRFVEYFSLCKGK
jgi:hypothetical protein